MKFNEKEEKFLGHFLVESHQGFFVGQAHKIAVAQGYSVHGLHSILSVWKPDIQEQRAYTTQFDGSKPPEVPWTEPEFQQRYQEALTELSSARPPIPGATH